VNYRESYGIHASNGILFNHESPRRGETFVTRKITRGLTRIKAGLDDCLYIGTLDSKRDWGYAPEYTHMMWLMLQQHEPDDYVVATGETHTVREFIEKACSCIGITLAWQGSGVDETGVDTITGRTIVRIDPRYFRPAEVDILIGNPAKAKQKLGWEPTVKFEELVKIMMDADVKALD
jgi:GDPmannose 4,6-dehydratase